MQRYCSFPADACLVPKRACGGAQIRARLVFGRLLVNALLGLRGCNPRGVTHCKSMPSTTGMLPCLMGIIKLLENIRKWHVDTRMYTWAEPGTKGAGLKGELSICTLWHGRAAIEAETSIPRSNTYCSSIRLIEFPDRC